MFPAAFAYLQVRSVDEALAALAKNGSDARILAGGQSLIPAMRYRLARPGMLVDINRIGELNYIREHDSMLAIGACTRDVAIERSPQIAQRYLLIADVSRLVADPVVRQMGTVVGSLCHSDPAGDWSVAALAGRAQIRVRGAKGERVVPIDEFLVDSFTTALSDGEMAIEVCFPTPDAKTSGAYAKLERKVGDFATAAAAAQLSLAADGTIAQAGIAIGAAGPKAQRVSAAEQLLRGTKPSRDAIRAAGEEAKKLANPAGDLRGSAAYKKEMAAVLVRRSLEKALERLGIGGMA